MRRRMRYRPASFAPRKISVLIHAPGDERRVWGCNLDADHGLP